MKESIKNNRTNILLFGILFLLLAWASYSVIFQTQGEEHPVSVILTDSYGDRWFAVREGMEQAASDYSILLNLPAVEKHPSASDEWDLISQEVTDGAHAVIVEPVGKNLMERSQELESEIDVPVILLDSDIEPEGVYDCIHADDKEIGRLLARELYEEYGDRLARKKIGVVGGEVSRLAMSQRLQGFYEELWKNGARTAWTLGLGRPLEKRLGFQLKRSRPDIIVALGSLETELVIDKVTELGLASAISIYGEGYSEKTVYYLNQGVINCLVLPNEYTMGYLAVERAARKINHIATKTENEPIDLHSVRSDEIYTEENQKILFPHIR